MKNDPFGNLTDWGPVLDTLADLSGKGALSTCQPGLIRILRYKGNWRLREEVLKRVGDIQTPSRALIQAVIVILADDNIYYDARIIAGKALVQLLKKIESEGSEDIAGHIQKVIKKIKSTPQPPYFDKAIDVLHSEIAQSYLLAN